MYHVFLPVSSVFICRVFTSQISDEYTRRKHNEYIYYDKKTKSFSIGSMEPTSTGSNNTTYGNLNLNGSDNVVNTGNSNVALGNGALEKNTTGSNNVAAGFEAMQNNLGGNSNVAIGTLALKGDTGTDGSCLGTTGQDKYVGSNNMALGYGALQNTISGDSNTAVGTFTLHKNIAGSNNTALGFGALEKNICGDNNTALGIKSLSNNIYGNDNLILGNNVGGGTMDLVWGPDIELIESRTSVHQFLGEGKYMPHLNSVYAGLGSPPTLTGTFGAAGTTNNFISLKTLTQRLQYGRDVLADFWKNQDFPSLSSPKLLQYCQQRYF